MSFNLFDLILLVICLAFALFSYMRGALRELPSLIGLGVGYLAAHRFYADLSDLLEPIVRDRSLTELLSFILIIALGYLVGTFVSGFGDMLRRKPPGIINSLGGAAIGLMKGLVISLAVFWVIDAYIVVFQDELAESLSAPFLAQLMDILAGYSLL